jgi:hypothetical protein
MAPTLHPPYRRSSTPPIVPTSNDGVLPLDLLLDILLRLPADRICRFRAVCRSWRFMLCHPDFIAAAQNPGPLLAAGVRENYSYYSWSWSYELKILNTDYGDEVKRVSRYPGYSSLDSMSHERVVCVTHSNRRIGLLDSGQRGALDRVARLALIKRRHNLSGAAIKRRHNCPREG